MEILSYVGKYLAGQTMTLLACVFCAWLLWGLYLMMMNLQGVRDKYKKEGGDLRLSQKIFAYPWLVIMVAVDFFFNVFFASWIFCDIPREWLLTARLNRYLSKDKGSWRYRLAKWFTKEYLNVFSPGNDHVKMPLE